MVSTKQGFAQLVNDNRAKLIKSYLFYLDAPQSMLAVNLTEHAIQAGYIDLRKPPPGRTLMEWSVQNSAPQWACRAAFDLLLRQGWKPETDTEKAIVARYIVLNDVDDRERWRELLGGWLIVAESVMTQSKGA